MRGWSYHFYCCTYMNNINMRQSKWRQLSLHFQSPTVQCPWVLTSDSILLHYCKHELDTDWFLKWMCYNSTIAAGQWIKTTHILVTLSLEWLNSYKEDISWSRFCIDISMHPKLILIISEFPRWTKTTVYQQDRLSVVVNIEIDEICVKNMIKKNSIKTADQNKKILKSS